MFEPTVFVILGATLHLIGARIDCLSVDCILAGKGELFLPRLACHRMEPIPQHLRSPCFSGFPEWLEKRCSHSSEPVKRAVYDGHMAEQLAGEYEHSLWHV